MRRKDREVTEIDKILAIIDRCKVCRLGLCDNGRAYVIPLNFGYTFIEENLTLYFHSAPEGKKIDLIRKNNSACFELDCDHKLLEGDKAGSYSYAYSSVIGFGCIEFIENNTDKIFALNALMKHQTGNDKQHNFNDNDLDSVAVYKLTVDEFTGKQNYGHN